MPVKQSYRPGYAARRMMHHTKVDFAVWLQNRKVAAAFQDPVIEVGKPSRMAALMGKKITPWIVASLALAIAGTALYIALRKVPDAGVLPGVAAAPRADVPAPAAPAPRVEAPAAPAPVPPAAVASLTAAPEPKAWVLPESYNLLLACKKDRTLYVYRREAGRAAAWRKLAAFPMAYGRKTGDKADKGDNRTPEGRYWINGIHPGPMKGPLYGALVFTLNYPKPGDQAEGKTGDGIWIHGVEEGKLPTYTHGCLSLANVDVLALADYIGVGTPIVILDGAQLPDPARQVDEAGMKREYPALMASAEAAALDTLARDKAVTWARTFVAREAKAHPGLGQVGITEAEKAAVLARLEAWRSDWISRDAERYGSHYAADFRDKEGRARQAFLDRKRRIFEAKQRIGMTMEDPRVEAEGYGRVKVTFRQDYEAEGADGLQRSSDMKSLRLEDGPGGWLIVSE